MELLYIVGALLAVILLWRGVVALREHRRRIRINLEPVPPGPELPESFPELGKVRVRPRFSGDEEPDGEPALGPVIVVSPRGRDGDEGARVTEVPASRLRAPREEAGDSPAAPHAAAAPSPAVVAPVADAAPETLPAAEAQAGSGDAPGTTLPASVAGAQEGTDATAPASDAAPAGGPGAVLPVLLTPVAKPLPDAAQQDMFADDMIAPPPMVARPRNRAEALYGTPAVEPVRSVRAAEARPVADIQDVIALHVVAREHPFNGEDLLRCILGYGLRFGDMNIFHRHERPTGQGRVLFSMAKAVEPGTFDLQAMTGEEIPGVSFFQSLPGVNSIHAYDIMVDTAKRLATELRGDILDEQQQPLTRQLVEHYRERVQEFERRRLMQRPVR